MAERLLDRLLTPKVVFGTLAAVIVIGSLLAPEGQPDDAVGTLSSLSYEPSGLRGWYEGAHRLGWRVRRREERFHGELDSRTVYVVLAPVIEPTASEVGALLGAVRRGAGLVVSSQKGSPLADSLHLYSDDFQYVGHPVVSGTLIGAQRQAGTAAISAAGSAAPDSSDDADDSDAPLGGIGALDRALDSTLVVKAGDADSAARTVTRRAPVASALAAYTHHVHAALTSVRTLPSDTTVFVSVMVMHRLTPTIRPAVLGLPLGTGRIAVLADPGIVRNAMLSEEKLVVLPQRLLEWAAPTPTASVVFDEYHHGQGNHGSALRAIRSALTGTPVGRAGLQILLAGLVLLVALGARPIGARARMRLERRSPLEHVGALSRAYMQKGATRLAARRLVRGIRRRHGAAARSSDDDAFLLRLAERHPALGPGVKRLIAATKNPVTPGELTLLADDIDTIERTLSK